MKTNSKFYKRQLGYMKNYVSVIKNTRNKKEIKRIRKTAFDRIKAIKNLKRNQKLLKVTAEKYGPRSIIAQIIKRRIKKLKNDLNDEQTMLD